MRLEIRFVNLGPSSNSYIGYWNIYRGAVSRNQLPNGLSYIMTSIPIRSRLYQSH